MAHSLRSLPMSMGAVSACQAAADPCCGDGYCRNRDEPRILFLDDLIQPYRRDPERDPYEERIETERHDFTQSTVTVGRGVFQLESGYTYFKKTEGADREASHTTPELMLRLGLTEDIEFRLRPLQYWRRLLYHRQFRARRPRRRGIDARCG